MADYTVKGTEEEKRMYRETGKRQAEEKNMKTYIEFLKDKVPMDLDENVDLVLQGWATEGEL